MSFFKTRAVLGRSTLLTPVIVYSYANLRMRLSCNLKELRGKQAQMAYNLLLSLLRVNLDLCEILQPQKKSELPPPTMGSLK